ncbi:tail fiber domain-containing protein [Pedobacter insulae]|uniref:Chaperone of endosialidase n=1 Tax=Pedobacter insulae TaxID=414048 RepID=A0A1I2Z0N2_9SPHI|nr:tail fiber domain-containing protein [Pedobacter insulae]SFH31089.1 Chaperone of endosialidase [Pedobacter insulae]
MNRKLLVIAMAIIGFAVQSNAQTIKQANIQPITNSLATIIKLNPVSFSYDQSWLEKLNLKPSNNGFNVEELVKVSPKLVITQTLNYNEGKNNNKTVMVPKVDYEALIPMLVGSIKEQQQQIEALKAEIIALKSKNAK